MTLYRIICTLFLISGAQLNGETGIMYFVWFSFVWREAKCGWLSWLFRWIFFIYFFSIMQCHSAQCVSKCARPVCSSSAPQTTCRASGCSTFIPGGAAFCSVTPNRWTSRVGKDIGENTPGEKLDASPSQVQSTEETSLLLIFFSRICCAVSWMRCAGLRFFLPPTKTEWKSWSQRNESGRTVGVLSSLQTRKGRMQTRLKKTRERRTGITRHQHINKQGLPADPRRSFSYFGGC